MERQITFVLTNSNDKKVINSNAETLGELKAEMDAHGINYTDMSFLEGLSKTELLDDASQLPHDINYKGTVTNNLVFLLTNTNKKIKSGAMSRNECYAYIKTHKIVAEQIKAFYNKNYTNCPTTILEEFIQKNEKANNKTFVNNTKAIVTRANCYAYIKDNNFADEVKRTFGKNYTNCTTQELLQFCNGITNTCKKKNNTTKTKIVKSVYSDVEIDSIIESLQN